MTQPLQELFPRWLRPNRRAAVPLGDISPSAIHRITVQTLSWDDDRFLARAKTVTIARSALLFVGAVMLIIPRLRDHLGLNNLTAWATYGFMWTYSIFNFWALKRPSIRRYSTFVTLCFDLVIWIIVISRPQSATGLHHSLLSIQLLYTVLFALIFPRPYAIVPPLLALLVACRLDQVLYRTPGPFEWMIVLVYFALNVVLIYILVTLNTRERQSHSQLVELQERLKLMAITNERSRISREIHDGVGASLTSLVLQAEYLSQHNHDSGLSADIDELKNTAQNSIDELRRNLRMMRRDFNLSNAIQDHIKTFCERTRAPVTISIEGEPPQKMPPEQQLSLFRALQESLNNAVKHAQASSIQVTLVFAEDNITLNVIDNGIGFDPKIDRPGHYGLMTLIERARQINGQLSIVSNPGQGTQVIFSVPISKAEEKS